MTICASCGAENRDGARFCDACGAPLTAPPPRGQERKVVSVLFVDIVGSTAAADGADPEDVRAKLAPYHARVKDEIERYGGTVEKFVGDAVMAVFGAPVAHEDDAERAVRAALRVLEACEELGVEARAAVDTGEALVALGARPEAGEALVAGDVVNTAARLQNVAPPGGTVVGELTQRTTHDAIVYEQLPAVELKGKKEPVALWLAKEARSRFGVDLERPATPFIGRRHEVALLTETHARTLRESAVQLVTITGEPGVGKTRLVTELREHLDALPDIFRWRQGRCLPYGDGITYWALSEIVKAHAGILETDGSEETLQKLSQSVAQSVDESEREWLVARLAALVGLEGGAGAREESFTAWRRFLEGIAASVPLVLVIEDLHWADEPLVEFLEHLVDRVTDVPFLLVCTARPELYERHPGWGGGKRNSTTISLSPLDADETSRLLAALLDQAVLPAETQSRLLERAGGNPLYAEEFVRMLRDRGLLQPGLVLAPDVPVPETVQALIAARLDTLPAERKAVLQDAAVLGKVFWRGGVAALGGRDEREVEEALRELVRKELVRAARVSSVEAEAEFAFWHGSIRDVAYGQIPREARAEKHRAAADWIESLSSDGGGRDELLAYHYEQALDLARAAGRDGLAAELLAPTLDYLVAGARRVLRVDHAAARSLAERALALAPAGHRRRADALLIVGRALRGELAPPQAPEDVLREALAAFREVGDPEGVGAALSDLAASVWSAGAAADEARELLDEAVRVLEAAGPSEELAGAHALRAFQLMVAHESERAFEIAEQAIAVARQIDSTGRGIMMGLQVRGGARCDLGDDGGLADMREALETGLAHGHGFAAAIAYVNLATYVLSIEGPAAALALQHEGIEFAERRGLFGQAMWTRAESMWPLFELGRWDELLAVAEQVERGLGSGGQPHMMVQAHSGLVHAWRGDLAQARAQCEDVLPRAREAQTPQVYAPALTLAVTVAWLASEDAAVLDLAREFAQLQGSRAVIHGYGIADVVRAVAAAGGVDVARALAAATQNTPRAERHGTTSAAVIAEVTGARAAALDAYRAAAAEWRERGHVLEEALALLGAARCGGSADEARAGRSMLAQLGVREAGGVRSVSAL